MIKLELTEADALLFKSFREHQDTFKAMLEAGVFETANGVIILNYNRDKVLTEIRKDIVTYKRSFAERL